jgi:peptidylprolyl isomerase/FKBP-type peptidyl-prolyl cis-trans isomerase FklB
MVKNVYGVLIALVIIFVPCCSKTSDEPIDEVWKSENENVFNALTFNSDYSRLSSPSNLGHIYYKVLKQGDGIEPIYYTDSIKMYYTGKLITDSVFDSAEPPYSAPVVSSVSSFCDGFAAAVQYMRKNDRWEIWLPQELGYGSTGTSSSGKEIIPPYSTLSVEVEIIGIKRHGIWY